jgi:ATP-binding cassette subfamily B protein
MFEPIRHFAGIFAEFQSSQAAAERVVDVLTATSDITDTPEVTERYGDCFAPKKENWEPIKGAVEFKNVSFWYKENEPC